jgi:transcriptional regulator with XRE-family HTH domain
MKIDPSNSERTILAEIGRRMAGLRLERNLKQSDLAEQAGVGLRTIQRLESGAAATQLSSFVRVCRILGLLDQFNQLVPEPAPSPIEQLKQRGNTRRRAFKAKSRSSQANETHPWTWGEST